MGAHSSSQVTQLLRAWSDGNDQALERLAPAVYEELRKIARRYMRRQQPGNTLQTTALVNEAYLRLVGAHGIRWQDRAHFFAVAAQMMRRILADAARARWSVKRGRGVCKIEYDEAFVASPENDSRLIALDDALQQLAKLDPRKVRVVELRFFGGLSAEETAAVLKVSVRTVLGDWRMAKAWLSCQVPRAGGRL